jgi:hypothetical protein
MSREVLVALAALLLAAWAPGAEATLSFDLTTEFSVAANPYGSPPWGTITFTQGNFNSADDNPEVQVVLSLNLQDTSEFLDEWWFNYTGNPTQLAITNTSGQAPSAINKGGCGPQNAQTNDCYKSDGDGDFDILIEFSSDAFTGLETSTFLIDLVGSDVTEAMFNALSAVSGGQGTFHTAAHIQGIDTAPGSGHLGDGGGGGSTQIPAPATIALLGVGLMAAAGVGGFWSCHRRK